MNTKNKGRKHNPLVAPTVYLKEALTDVFPGSWFYFGVDGSNIHHVQFRYVPGSKKTAETMTLLAKAIEKATN